MLEAYLRELQRELSRTLPDEDVKVRLTEAEAHLRDGIEARVELGLDPSEAEREAVATFGQTRHLAQANTETTVSPKARLLCLGSGYVLALLWTQILIEYSGTLPQLNLWLFVAWIALGFLFAVLAFLARRPRPVSIFLTVFGSTILTWMVLATTWLDLSAFGGSGVTPRNAVEGMIGENRRLLAERQRSRLDFEAGWKTIHGPEGIEGVRLPQGYRAPLVGASYPNALSFKTVSDAKGALQAWTEVHRHGEAFETTSVIQNLAAIAEAQAHPWENTLSMATGIFEANLGVAATAILVDYAFSGLGTLFFRRRKGRRRGVA